MSLTSVFNRSLDGLTAAQRALAAAANNVANANTKGYARQEVILGARPGASGNASLAGGVEILGIKSNTDSFLEMQLFQTSNYFGTVDGRKKTVSQLESVFNESQDQGLGKALSEFFNSFSDLANHPSSVALRQGVKDKATILSDRFNQMSAQLQSMKKNLSSEIVTRLGTINSYASQIADLNEAIVNAGGSDKALDLAAQRTYLLRELSTEINVSYWEDSRGAVQVQLAGGGSLVSNFSAGTIDVTSDNLNPGGDIALALTFAGSSSSVDVTSRITGGRLGGNLLDRNTTLNDQLDDLDTLAYQLSIQVNALHSTGYGLNGTTGTNFFSPLASSTNAAANFSVDATILSNPNLIAAASQDPSVSGASDNRKALQLAALQNSLTMSSGTESFSQYYQGLVGSVGVMAGSVNRDFDNKSYLMNQMEVQRESVSGVNMDEEGASIIQFQKAFQAASRLMVMADKLMDDLLRI